jgi:hypothetical protein
LLAETVASFLPVSVGLAHEKTNLYCGIVDRFSDGLGVAGPIAHFIQVRFSVSVAE